MQGHWWSLGVQVNPQPPPDLQGDTCSDPTANHFGANGSSHEA